MCMICLCLVVFVFFFYRAMSKILNRSLRKTPKPHKLPAKNKKKNHGKEKYNFKHTKTDIVTLPLIVVVER